jgi:hypothetical protein
MKIINEIYPLPLMLVLIWGIVYMMVHAWDKECEYQQQKEKQYYEGIRNEKFY